MSIGIGDNLTQSFEFSKEKLGGNIGTWLILSILNLIPIVDWIVYGTYVKILRGEEPDLNNMGKSFVDGLLALIIGLIYMIIPILLIIVLSIGTFSIGSMTATPGPETLHSMMLAGAGLALNIGLVILCLIVAFLFALIAKPAVVNFARNGFGAAFKFGEIFSMISKAGWLKYILSLLVFWIIFGVIIFVCVIIPVLGWILLIFILPFLYFWGAKYLANLFE